MQGWIRGKSKIDDKDTDTDFGIFSAVVSIRSGPLPEKVTLQLSNSVIHMHAGTRTNVCTHCGTGTLTHTPSNPRRVALVSCRR